MNHNQNILSDNQWNTGLKNKYQGPRHKRAHETSWVTATSTNDGKSLEFKQLFFTSVMYVSPL
jgi:hypothetical protein